MRSIITDDMEHCIHCGSTMVEIHHIMFGTANRKLSDKYGLVVPLCPYCHRGGQGVHQNRQLDLKLKKLAQSKFEQEYPDLDWLEIFGRNYK